MSKNKRLLLASMGVMLSLTGCSSSSPVNPIQDTLSSVLAVPEVKYNANLTVKPLVIPSDLTSPNLNPEFSLPANVATVAQTKKPSDSVPSVTGSDGAIKSQSESITPQKEVKRRGVLTADGQGLIIPEVGDAAWQALGKTLKAADFTIESATPGVGYATVWNGEKFKTLATLNSGFKITIGADFIDDNDKHIFNVAPYQEKSLITLRKISGIKAESTQENKIIFEHLAEFH